MPSEILSRIPLPSLRVYTSFSVLLLAGCLYYSFSVTSDPTWKDNVNITSHHLPPEINLPVEGGGGGEESVRVVVEDVAVVAEIIAAGSRLGGEDGDFRSILDHMRDIMSFMGQEAICIWVSLRQGWQHKLLSEAWQELS